MTEAQLRETAAEVAALIPRYEWQIMDEEQKDALMAKVLPLYMKTTADGVQLGPTWWGQQLGATAPAIKNRVQRLQAKQQPDTGSRRKKEQKAQDARAAKRILREADPEDVADLLDDPAIRQNVYKAQDLRQKKAEKKSDERLREEIGDETVEGLEFAQKLADAEMCLITARGNIRGFVKHARELEGDMPSRWRDSCLDWISDLDGHLGMGRALLEGGTLTDDDLQALLKGE